MKILSFKIPTFCHSLRIRITFAVLYNDDHSSPPLHLRLPCSSSLFFAPTLQLRCSAISLSLRISFLTVITNCSRLPSWSFTRCFSPLRCWSILQRLYHLIFTDVPLQLHLSSCTPPFSCCTVIGVYNFVEGSPLRHPCYIVSLPLRSCYPVPTVISIARPYLPRMLTAIPLSCSAFVISIIYPCFCRCVIHRHTRLRRFVTTLVFSAATHVSLDVLLEFNHRYGPLLKFGTALTMANCVNKLDYRPLHYNSVISPSFHATSCTRYCSPAVSHSFTPFLHYVSHCLPLSRPRFVYMYSPSLLIHHTLLFPIILTSIHLSLRRYIMWSYYTTVRSFQHSSLRRLWCASFGYVLLGILHWRTCHSCGSFPCL